MKVTPLFFPAVIFTCLLSGIFISCNKVSEPNYVDAGHTVFTGDGSVSQLVPAGTSAGTARLYAVYDNNSKIFNIKLSWYGLSGTMTAANFYGPALNGQTGPVTRNIVTGQTKNMTDSVTTVIWNNSSLSPAELDDLKNGKWYYTIITQSNTGGEIRGQISIDHTY
ncbi:MAG: hypothetical protein JWR38_2792 [Mucilaginibacter sp.]|nr:hypothetical protein [Mucilaginibacter sp.]